MPTYTIPTKTYIDTQDATKVSTSDMLGAVGNIMSPLLDMPLKNSLAMKAGVGDVTFTRASTATYIDRYGVLQYAAIDESRLEKDGMLIEGTSTNLYLQSSDFISGWVLNGATKTQNATTAPDGSNNAISLADNGNGFITHTTSVTAGVTYTTSIFAKAGTTNKVWINLLNTSWSGDIVVFDLTLGTITSSNSSATATITELADGWYRCSATDVCTTTATTQNVRLNSVGTNIGETIYLWGAQLEALPFATSYIPTTTAEAHRLADKLSVQYANNMPLWKDKHTILIDFDLLGLTHTTNRLLLSTGILGNGYVDVSTSGFITYSTTGGNSSSNLLSKITNQRAALINDGSITKSYFDGIQKVDTGTVGTNTEVSTEIFIGSESGALQYHYGHISNFRIYDKALTAQEVALA